MRNTGFITVVLFFAVSAFSCGEKSTNSAQSRPIGEPAVASRNASSTANSSLVNAAAETVADAKATAPSVGNQSGRRPVVEKISLDQGRTALIDTAPTDRKIIRNAELTLEVDSPEQVQPRIAAIAETSGGFVVESQQATADTRGKDSGVVSMVLRVPAQSFADTLEKVRAASQRVVFETVKGDDVTEEFIDVEARLKAKKALEQQFVEIMKRANTVDDALSVQSQLADVRGEIEKIEGRKRFLENQASLSTIKLRLQTPEAFSTASTGFSYRLAQSFGTGFDFALNFVLGLVTFVVGVLPFALLIGLPGFLIVRYVVKRQNKPRSVVDIVKEEINTK